MAHKKTILDWALWYHEQGWCIIPIPYGKKKALIRWGKYQQKRPDEKKLRQWFSSGTKNVAVILGSISGDLACRDFDAMAERESWVAEHSELAKTLPTARTSRGVHVYFQYPVEGRRDIKGPNGEHLGELRGSGHYCLLPPSLHPEGTPYEWLNPISNGNLLTVDPELAGFLTNNSDVTERSEENRGEYRRTEEIEVEGCIEKLIIETLPKELRTRHRRVFDFARKLWSLPQYTEADPVQFRSVVMEWHRRALPNIRTKEFEETWIDFLKAWGKVKWKIGENPMAQVFEKTIRLEPPPIAVEKYPENDKMKLLVSLCRELQRATGKGRTFFLSCRTAANLLGVRPMTVSRWFFLLETDGILKTVSKGKMTKGGGIATRFRYIGN
jgi:hypothetical protein